MATPATGSKRKAQLAMAAFIVVAFVTCLQLAVGVTIYAAQAITDAGAAGSGARQTHT